ncbi:beta-like DNA polymerase [Vibrio phage Va2]|nr:beta-like DNA polymerase [Vibrio phage Va2]
MSNIVVKCDKNVELVNFFTRISSLYYAKKDARKGSTFARVASTCAAYETEITQETDLTVHPRIGSSSQKEKDQFLEKGTSNRLIELLNDVDSPAETFQDKLIRLVTMHIGKHAEGKVKSSIILTCALNRIKSVDDALANVDKFESFLQDAVKDILPKIKEGN